MKFPRRKAAARADVNQAAWYDPPRLADRSCCCPARPVVRVLIPPTAERRHAADLLLCGHHYLTSRAALAAANAVAIDETGAVLEPPSTSTEEMSLSRNTVKSQAVSIYASWAPPHAARPVARSRQLGLREGMTSRLSSHQGDGTCPGTRWNGARRRGRCMGQTARFQETLRRLARIDEGFVESEAGLGLARPGHRRWIPRPQRCCK